MNRYSCLSVTAALGIGLSYGNSSMGVRRFLEVGILVLQNRNPIEKNKHLIRRQECGVIQTSVHPQGPTGVSLEDKKQNGGDVFHSFSMMDWLKSAVAAVKIHPFIGRYTPLPIPVSVNYFPHRCHFLFHISHCVVADQITRSKCNYSCGFCFHTTKNLSILPLEEAKRGLQLLADAGMKKLNISGTGSSPVLIVCTECKGRWGAFPEA